MAVDPGDKHIGLAISDIAGIIANPLIVISHISRLVDAASIAQIALENDVALIVVGEAVDDEGEVSPQGRKAQRLAEVIQNQGNIQVVLWDESFSTSAARKARLDMGVRRKKRSGHLDDLAATVLLQSYLDANQQH